MSGFLHEVDEAMRQEKMARIWSEYGNIIIAGILCLIIGTGAFSFYGSWNTDVKEEQTSILLDINGQNTVDLAQIQAQLPDLREDVAAMARLQAAQKLLDEGKTNDALTLYNELAESNAAPTFRDLAVLVSTRLDETITGQDAIERLSEITSVWQFYALMDIAVIYANDMNDYDQALSSLNKILAAEIQLPQSFENRARALKHVYELKNKNDAKKEDQKS